VKLKYKGVKLFESLSHSAIVPVNIYLDLLSSPPCSIPFPEGRQGWRPYCFDEFKFEILHKNNDLEKRREQKEEKKGEKYQLRDISLEYKDARLSLGSNKSGSFK
jgi:hypothetical protein